MTRGGGRGSSAARGRCTSSTTRREESVARGCGSGSIARFHDQGVQGGRRNVARGRGVSSPSRGGIGLRDASIDPFINTDDEFDISHNDEEYVESTERQARGLNMTQQARGSNMTPQALVQQSHREIIVPYGKRFEDPSVGKEIVNIFKSMFSGCWPRWTDVPKVNRRLMWERFQAIYQWDPSLEVKVEENWNFIMKDRYSDIMSLARSEAIGKAKARGIHVGDNLTLLKPFFPEWIDEANWAAMIDDVWNTEKWKQGSNANKRNRVTLVDGKISVHSGGSLSYDHHRLKMEKERGGPLPEVDVFKNFYQKKKKKSSLDEATDSDLPVYFVTERDEKALDAYMKLVVEKYGEDQAHHPMNIDRDL